MATGNQDGQKRKFDRLSQAMPHALCMPNLHSVTEHTMKKVGGSGGTDLFHLAQYKKSVKLQLSL